MAFDYNEEARKAEERFTGKPADDSVAGILKKAQKKEQDKQDEDKKD